MGFNLSASIFIKIDAVRRDEDMKSKTLVDVGGTMVELLL